jgi:hypothetical protein
MQDWNTHTHCVTHWEHHGTNTPRSYIHCTTVNSARDSSSLCSGRSSRSPTVPLLCFFSLFSMALYFFFESREQCLFFLLYVCICNNKDEIKANNSILCQFFLHFAAVQQNNNVYCGSVILKSKQQTTNEKKQLYTYLTLLQIYIQARKREKKGSLLSSIPSCH